MESNNVNFFSLNVNGMGDEIKRQAVFDKLKRKGPGIFMLQETHTTPIIESKWISQWGSRDIIFSHGTSAKKGVAILISRNVEHKIINTLTDKEGRFIITDIKLDDRIYTVINIYAPTRNYQKEQIKVLTTLIEYLEAFKMEHIIFGGDMNVYMDAKLDKLDSMPDSGDNPEFRSNINCFLDTYNMVDVWRTLNPTKRIFTFHRGNTRSRLDYFFASEHLLNSLVSADILPGFHSDHSLICLIFNNEGIASNGRGFWKFNSSLLHDTTYVNNIKQIITQCISTYNSIEDKRVVWELVKMDIRNYTIPFCVNKKKTDLEYENSLYKKHSELHALVQTESVNENIITEFNLIKYEIEQVERHKAKGVILRSKCKWTEEGEYNTSYFLRLEKNNYCNKVISQLEHEGNIIKDANQILHTE